MLAKLSADFSMGHIHSTRSTQASCKSLIFILLTFLFASSFTNAQTNSFDVSAVERVTDLSAAITYLRLPPDAAVTKQIPALPNLSAFEVLPNDEISFGYTSDVFWFMFTTVNSSESATQLVLDTNVKFMEPLIIFELLDGRTLIELLKIDENSLFAARPIATPKVTLPLSWEPTEQRQFLVYVASGSGVDLSLQLGSSEMVNEKYINNNFFFVLLTGILSTLILINLFNFYAVRRLAHLVYAGQELAILFFMLHIDGIAFQYVWPNSPSWNAHATMVFGHLVNLMALLFAISFLELKSRSRVLYILLSIPAAIAFLMLILTPFVEPEFSDMVGLYTAGLGGILIFTTGLIIAVNGYRPARYFVVGWLFMSIGTVIYGLANLAVISLPFAPLLVLRTGILVEALLLSYGLSDQLKSLSDTARQVQKDLLASTEKRLQEVQESVRLEQERDEAARDLLEKDLDIARARHDIRQPIYSLRLALLASKPDQASSATHEVINRSLDHMEQLLLDKGDTVQGGQDNQFFAAYGDLFAQLRAEFIDEAKSKGALLTVHYSSLPMHVPQVPLKRVVSNLLANALRHAGASRVVVGLRRKAAGAEILVIDNGIGISENVSENRGEGLGMGIVRALCAEHGWVLSYDSVPGLGTCFRIGLQN